MFIACIVIMCVISIFTRPVPLDLLGALTWKTINKPRFREGPKSAEYVVSSDMKMEKVKFDSSKEVFPSVTAALFADFATKAVTFNTFSEMMYYICLQAATTGQN